MTMRYPWEPPPCSGGHVFAFTSASTQTTAPQPGQRCNCGMVEWGAPQGKETK